MARYRKGGLIVVFAWFFLGGAGHFVATDFFTSIVPPYIPYPREMVYFTGVLELLGAVGVLLPQTRRMAGAGLFLLTLCVTPANVHMWLHPEQFAFVPPALLSVRLVIQMALLGCIAWAIVLPGAQPVAQNA